MILIQLFPFVYQDADKIISSNISEAFLLHTYFPTLDFFYGYT